MTVHVRTDCVLASLTINFKSHVLVTWLIASIHHSNGYTLQRHRKVVHFDRNVTLGFKYHSKQGIIVALEQTTNLHNTFFKLFSSASWCSTTHSWLDTASSRLSCISSKVADLRKTPTQSTGKTALSHSSSFPRYSSHKQGGLSLSPSEVRPRSREAVNWLETGNWSFGEPLGLLEGVGGASEAMGDFANLPPCLQRAVLPSEVETSRQLPCNSEWTTFRLFTSPTAVER